MRLNTVIALLEQGQTPITVFSPPTIESAIEFATTKYDGVVFEAEHNPYDIKALRDCLQYLLNRKQIVERGSVSPAVTPIIRIRRANLSRSFFPRRVRRVALRSTAPG